MSNLTENALNKRPAVELPAVERPAIERHVAEPKAIEWPDLASARLGGTVLAANDDFFAPKENLVKESPAVWDADRYTDRGKWMDGWESRRRRTPGHDWSIIRLGCPGRPVRIVVDTAHFTGNYPEACSIEATSAPANATVEELQNDTEWIELLPQSDLDGDRENPFEINAELRATHLRLNIYPDGGVARLRVFGEALPERLSKPGATVVDVASVLAGGRVLDASDRFYSAPEKLLLPDSSRGMFDGWETRRRRDDGNDWVIVGLAAPATVSRAIVDTRYFKGNAPGWCSIEAASSGGNVDRLDWQPLLERVALAPHTVHSFQRQLRSTPSADRIRLQIYPDGGLARLRLFGEFDAAAQQSWALRRLHLERPSTAEHHFLTCCGSPRWAQQMADERPFDSVEQLYERAAELWTRLDPNEWLTAFRAHPRIGETETPDDAHLDGSSATSKRWSTAEQSGTTDASNATLERLAAGNRQYEETFGFVFLICATGKSADEMLAALDSRLTHDPRTELRIAAAEQAKITRLRLEKLLGGS